MTPNFCILLILFSIFLTWAGWLLGSGILLGVSLALVALVYISYRLS